MSHYKEHEERAFAALDEKLNSPVKGATTPKPDGNKYHREIWDIEGSNAVTVDVYSVLEAFKVTSPPLQHLIKKALCAGLRGHKNELQDLDDIVESAKRARIMCGS